MTKEEFTKPYNALAEHFGPNAYTLTRAKLLFALMQELPAMWWVALVNRMIRANDARFDIDGAARTEIAHMRAHARREDESLAYRNFNRQLSEKGYQETLGKFKAKSLWEAVEKSKQRKF